jgi:phosphosulfolactate synthase (CoM biosynthesis protein A)
MTNAERNKRILKAIDAKTKRVIVSKKAARESLVEEGIYTKKGKLRAEFGGNGSKKEAEAA